MIISLWGTFCQGAFVLFPNVQYYLKTLLIIVYSNVIITGIYDVFSLSCQWQCEFLLSLGIRRPLTFHILIFSSETTYCSYMNRNLVGSIYGRSLIQIAHFIPIH